METSEPVVANHGREVGGGRSRRGAAVCFNGWLGGLRLKLVGVSDGEFLQEGGEPAFVEETSGNGKHGVVEPLIGIGDNPAVDIEKHKGGVERRTLVPVNEGLVFSDVKSVGSRHVKQAFVEKDAIESRGRRGDGRIERAFVSNSVRPTEETQLISVEVQNLIDGKEERFTREVHLANFRKVPS